MDKVRGSYKAAIWLIYLSLFVFFAGFSLVYALGSHAPLSGGSVMLLSGASLLFSVLCSLVCLVGCQQQGIITRGDVVISIVASMFFFVFGYMAAVFTLGASIRAHDLADAEKVATSLKG